MPRVALRLSMLPFTAVVLAASCYGGRDLGGHADVVDDNDPDPSSTDPDANSLEPSPTTFECDPSQVPADVPLRRLTKVQVDNSVRDLLRWALPQQGDGVADLLAPQLAAIPDDARLTGSGEVHGGFSRLDQNVHQEHVNAMFEVGRAMGSALTRDSGRLSVVVGSCATDDDVGNDDRCIDDFIRRFGERAARRPLYEDEVSMYREVFDADGVTEGTEAEAFADVITVMIASPDFMYMIEHGEEEVEEQPGAYALSAHELASRLSYHLWQTMPDDELRAAAHSGALRTPEGYRAQVDRLFADPRTRGSLREFYRQWLRLDDVPPMDALVGDPRFDAFRGDFTPGPKTHEHMIDEALSMLEHLTFEDLGSLDDVMLEERSFAEHEDVAALYGVMAWQGGDPPALPAGERVGLLARAALTASGTANTRPIMKGVFIRTALLCQTIPPPPEGADAMPPAPDPDLSTREVVEQLTEQDGSACRSCHANFINPLGFATEGYDALGRVRSEQVLFDAQGQPTATRPIDTRSVPQIITGDPQPSEGAADLAVQILDSGQLQACFARQYLRFTNGRAEDVERDGCALNDLTGRLNASAPLSESLRAIALRPEFKQRLID